MQEPATTRPLLLLRVDVSHEHGTGHLMRCKALADAWQRTGGETEIVTTSDLTPYRRWLGELRVRSLSAGVSVAADAAEMRALARSRAAAWVAADGYHFDAAWQADFCEGDTRLLLFDDYGHGAPHAAQFVLNQNPSATPALYAQKQARTRLLLGPQYAVLREQFLPWRGWRRETPQRALRLLVTFGGTDPVQMTAKAIEALRGVEDLEADIVVGAGNPCAAEIERLADDKRLHIQRDVLDMPALMAGCDFALAAAGSTTLECAFLRLPQLLVTVADNQRGLAAALAASGAAEHLGWHTEVSCEQIAAAVRALRDSPERRAAMSAAGGKLVDGLGSARVVAQMRALQLRLQPAAASDARLVWTWANDPATRVASFQSEPIAWTEHERWFAERLRDPHTILWILHETAGPNDSSSEPAGVVRFTLEKDESTISVTLAPERRGRGLGAALILRASREVFRATAVSVIHAHIKPENAASLSAFATAGYRCERAIESRTGRAEHYCLARSTLPPHELD